MEKKTFMQKLKNMACRYYYQRIHWPWHHYHRYPGGR